MKILVHGYTTATSCKMSTAVSLRPFQFQNPTSIAIYAPPYSGKSTLALKILQNSDELFSIPPKFIVYCYKERMPVLEQYGHDFYGMEFILHKGLPRREDMEKWTTGKHFAIVLDDMQQQCEKDKDAAEMFTVGSHHLNYTIIYLCHNIFGRGAFSRLINLNSHYIILFRNNRDSQQVRTLGRQIFGNNSSYFLDAYTRATAKQWGYLLINLHPSTPVDSPNKLLTNILPGEMMTMYLPRD